MDLRAYLQALRKNWWIILTTFVLGCLASGIAYQTATPRYASTIDLYVSTPLREGSNPQSAAQYAEARVDSYVLLLKSEALARLIVRSQGLSLSPSEVASRIIPSAEPNTVVINVRVVDTDAANTFAIAQGIEANFGTMVSRLDNQGNAASTVVINVISGPTLLRHQVAPRLQLYAAVGVAAGLLVGVLLALLRELLDTSTRSSEVAAALVGAPIIGDIAFDPSARRRPLIINEEATSVRAEAYRQLRTNLQFIGAAQSSKVLMFTSALPMEGKSTSVVNLALTLVEAGEKVLVVEADLRRPKVADLLGLEREVGLSNVLIGQVSLEQAIQPWGGHGLHLLASGSIPPNPSELLGGARMRALIDELRRRYDKVIIDVPPVLPVTDAVVASQVTDGVVFVVHWGKTKRAQVAAAARMLRSVEAEIVGTVMNMRRRENRRYGHEYAYMQTDKRLLALQADVEAEQSGEGNGSWVLPPQEPRPGQVAAATRSNGRREAGA